MTLGISNICLIVSNTSTAYVGRHLSNSSTNINSLLSFIFSQSVFRKSLISFCLASYCSILLSGFTICNSLSNVLSGPPTHSIIKLPQFFIDFNSPILFSLSIVPILSGNESIIVFINGTIGSFSQSVFHALKKAT